MIKCFFRRPTLGRYIGLLLSLSLMTGVSGCALDPTPNTKDRSVLPAARQPTLPSSNRTDTAPEKPRPPQAFKLPEQGFPWTVSYRQNDVNGSAKAAREAMARYDIALLNHTQSVDDDIRELAKSAPSQVRILNISPDTRPKGDRKVFPGHWLLYNGTVITSDMAALDGVTLVSVEDPSVFGASSAELWPDDVLIYSLGEDGKPDFTHAEEATIARIDTKKKMVTLKRAQYGSRAREFIAGKAVIASHATRGRRDAASWVVNISRQSPVSPAGLRGAESLAKIITEEFRSIEPAPHGIQLESAQWEIYAGSSNKRRGPDTDNDRHADWGYAAFQNSGSTNGWGLGSVDLVRYLRNGGKGFDGLGKDAGIWVAHNSAEGSRAVEFANGVSFDSFDQDARRGFSSAVSRLEVLSRASKSAPQMSYILVNTPTAAFFRGERKPETNAPYRLGLGTALLNGMAFGYASAEPLDRASLGFGKNYYLDEYDAGKADKPNYLGKALGPTVRLSGTMKREDMLNQSGKSASGYSVPVSSKTVTVTDSLQSRRQGATSVQIDAFAKETVMLSKQIGIRSGNAYTVSFWARAENLYGNLDAVYQSIPSAIQIGLSDSLATPQSLLLTREWSQHNITFYTASSASQAQADGSVEVTLSDPGSVWLQDLEVHEGTSDVLYRHFEGGVVIVNGSNQSVSVDTDMVGPGMKYRTIEGERDTVVNDGKPAPTQVVVPAYDARILIK